MNRMNNKGLIKVRQRPSQAQIERPAFFKLAGYQSQRLEKVGQKLEQRKRGRVPKDGGIMQRPSMVEKFRTNVLMYPVWASTTLSFRSTLRYTLPLSF
jgi:hypothetical protein